MMEYHDDFSNIEEPAENSSAYELPDIKTTTEEFINVNDDNNSFIFDQCDDLINSSLDFDSLIQIHAEDLCDSDLFIASSPLNCNSNSEQSSSASNHMYLTNSQVAMPGGHSSSWEFKSISSKEPVLKRHLHDVDHNGANRTSVSENSIALQKCVQKK